MTIKINSYFFDKITPVALAKTILHEIIHAHIYQKVASIGGLNNLSTDNFERLFANSEAVRMGNRTETHGGVVVFHEIFVRGEISPSGDLPNLIRLKFKDEDIGLYESV